MGEFLAGSYGTLKALHIISVIAWMAGMMYLPRLFIYHHQSTPGGEAEGFFVIMERRLLKGIINVAMIATWSFAILMLIANPGLFSVPWFHAKLTLVLILSGIHGFYASSQKKFAAGERPRSEKFWRIMNEAPFIIAIIVVFLAVTKPF